MYLAIKVNNIIKPCNSAIKISKHVRVTDNKKLHSNFDVLLSKLSAKVMRVAH